MAKRIVSWERKRKRLGYFFILPFIIGAVFFLLIPLITSLRYSFSNLTVNSTGTGYDLAFVGIQNYYQLLAVDPTYRQVLLEAIWNMIINVPIAVVFSFFIASILNQKFRGRGLVRGIFFLPVLLSSGNLPAARLGGSDDQYDAAGRLLLRRGRQRGHRLRQHAQLPEFRYLPHQLPGVGCGSDFHHRGHERHPDYHLPRRLPVHFALHL